MVLVQKFYPTKLADKTWDNTGLLLDSSIEESVEDEKVKILLTIDLTQDVADEAISSNSNLIMAYHPFIFKGLKSISPTNPQQFSMLKLIRNGISVYCPHTAVDSAKGGVNDFLADGILQTLPEQLPREIIEKDKTEEGCGMGRIVTLKEPTPLSKLVDNVKLNLDLSHVQVALARGKKPTDLIQTIAICAGSGGSVFSGVKADLFYTGELSHHEALYLKEIGSSVIVCNHSNTERAFLKVMQKQLEDELPEGSEVIISKEDKDPYSIW